LEQIKISCSEEECRRPGEKCPFSACSGSRFRGLLVSPSGCDIITIVDIATGGTVRSSREKRNRIIIWIISLLVVLSMALGMAETLVSTRRVTPTPLPSPTPFPTWTPTPNTA
jgi:hypothetical protein